ncbi:MAG: hypothetical protein JRF25_05560 [Deltaproteobacteria bacterium]|nr:hypothetical protein [Deltaproteobacteria bacterium]
MSKKKKKDIAKRRTQTKAKKQKRSKIKSLRSAPNVQLVEKPSISTIDTPPGFREVSFSRGLMEYAKPLMNYVEKGIAKDPNDAFQITTHTWNFDIPLEQGEVKIDKKDIIKEIEKTLKMNSQESVEFFEMMIRRKEHLFPKDIQSDNQTTMFIRQEVQYIIPEFNYDSLNISEEIYAPTNKDVELVESLNKMDKNITDGTDYAEWEDHYFEVEEKCKEKFENWLKFKGIKGYSEVFPYNVEIYLNFIYRYMHDDPISLKKIKPVYIEEFFADYVLRKVIVEPHEYVTWPPALKLFYMFLKEIGYLERHEKFIKLLDEIEPVFVEILKEMYS